MRQLLRKLWAALLAWMGDRLDMEEPEDPNEYHTLEGNEPDAVAVAQTDETVVLNGTVRR